MYSLRFNEVMANNASTRLSDVLPTHDPTDYPDWAEIYNGGGTPVDLNGIILTNWGGTKIFRFPTYNLPAGGYLLVIYDDLTNTPGEFHTGFTLNASGDRAVMLTPDAITELDWVGFGKQIPDYSIGRYPNGTGLGDANWQLNLPTPGRTNATATLASGTYLRFNEWMPTNGAGSHSFDDWLELYNLATNPVALGGLVITNALMPPGFPVPSTAMTVSNLSFIDANGFAQFWCVGKRTTKTYDADEINFKLSFSSGETLALYAGRSSTNLYDTVTFYGQSSTNIWMEFTGYTTNIYCTNPPNPCITVITTNYAFYSQGRLPDGATNFMFFRNETPDNSNFQPLSALWPGLRINEILAHTDPPLQDALELYNANPTQAVNLSYYWLSNDKNDSKKYRFPANFIIQPLGYKVVYEYQFNPDFTGTNRSFTFNSAHGDGCYIFSASNDASGTLTGYRMGTTFDSSENGVSFGRYTNSQGDVDYTAMSKLSFGSIPPTSSNLFVLGQGLANPAPLIGPVVMTEIMYHPPDLGTNDNTWDEYIQLYNMSTNIVKLYDTNSYDGAYTNHWNINKAVDFEFPTNNVIRPGEFILIVGFDPANPTNAAYLQHFRALYNIPDSFTNIFGPLKGKLSNGGDTIEWRKTDPRQIPPHPDAGYVPNILVDKVKYNDKWPWPTNAVGGVGKPDGGGAAIRRVKPDCYGNEPTNWIAAVPTPGRLPLKVDSARFSTNNTATLTISNVWAAAGCTVQYCTNLQSPPNLCAWTKLADLLPLTTTTNRVVTDVLAPGTKRFYRVVTPIQ